MKWKVDKLAKGESFITSAKGNSMNPLIKSGQEFRLVPAKWEDVKVDDIVFCKVNGNFYYHLVKAKDDNKGCQIGNYKGFINGWTKQIFGKIEII